MALMLGTAVGKQKNLGISTPSQRKVDCPKKEKHKGELSQKASQPVPPFDGKGGQQDWQRGGGDPPPAFNGGKRGT